MSGEYRFCGVESAGRLLVVTLRRTNVGNMLHGPAHRELEQVFDAFVADDALDVAIVTGEGQYFCLGEDAIVRELSGEQPLPRSGFGGLTSRFDNPKPVIAAVNGDAIAGGFELALACDLVIADETASFAMEHVQEGRVAAAGGIHRLVRSAPLKKAMAVLLTGRRISAAEGVLLGFVNELVAPGMALNTARALAHEILTSSPRAIRAAKEVAMRGLELPGLEAAMAASYPAVEALSGSDDGKEAASARREGRRPRWAPPV